MKRQIFSARDLAQALADCEKAWQAQPPTSHPYLHKGGIDAFISDWAKEHIVPEWYWPFYLLATSEYVETDQWIKENQ